MCQHQIPRSLYDPASSDLRLSCKTQCLLTKGIDNVSMLNEHYSGMSGKNCTCNNSLPHLQSGYENTENHTGVAFSFGPRNRVYPLQ